MRFEGLSAGMNQVIAASHFDTVLSVEEKLGALVETVGRNPAGWPGQATCSSSPQLR
jgi:hypothetical protein